MYAGGSGLNQDDSDSIQRTHQTPNDWKSCDSCAFDSTRSQLSNFLFSLLTKHKRRTHLMWVGVCELKLFWWNMAAQLLIKTVKMLDSAIICWSLTRRQNGEEIWVKWLWVPDGLKNTDLLRQITILCRVYSETVWKRENIQMRENVLLMSKVRLECPDCFQMIGRQQLLK